MEVDEPTLVTDDALAAKLMALSQSGKGLSLQVAHKARAEDLATEAIDGGVLVYDLKSNQVHWLDASATAVWRLADGERSVAEIAHACELTEKVVAETLSRIAALDLIEPRVQEDGVTRRLAIRRVAVAGGAVAFAGPLISSILAPTAAMANTATCDAVTCSGTDSGACANGKAKKAADNVCTTPPNNPGPCRGSSTCVGTCTPSSGSPSSFSGHCSF